MPHKEFAAAFIKAGELSEGRTGTKAPLPSDVGVSAAFGGWLP